MWKLKESHEIDGEKLKPSLQWNGFIKCTSAPECTDFGQPHAWTQTIMLHS